MFIVILGGRNNYRDSNNYGRDGGDREFGNRRFDNRNKGGDEDWDFEQNDNRGPPRRTPRSEDDFSRMRGGDRGGGRGTPYNRDRGGGGYEERGSRGGRDERDGNRGGNRYSRDDDGPRGGRGNGGPRDMDGGGPPKQSYVPPENDDCEGERIRMGKNFAKYEDTDVKITGPGHEDIQVLDTDFENSNLVPLLRQHLRAQQFERPTPVQKCAIPCILADKDIMACAQTGSGKTAAFLLPVISRLIELGVESREMNRQVPDVVIVIPTRELAVQVHFEARRFCKGSKLVAQVLYGGTDVRHQKSVSSRIFSSRSEIHGPPKNIVGTRFSFFMYWSDPKFFCPGRTGQVRGSLVSIIENSSSKCENHLFLVLSHLDDLKGQTIFPFTHRYTFRVLHLAHTYFPRELLFQSTLIFIERKYRKCEK